MSDNPFRALPSVNDVLQVATVRALENGYAHEAIVAAE